MSIKELLENQVSTTFLLSMTGVVGTFAYGWLGPLAGSEAMSGQVMTNTQVIIGIYAGRKIFKDAKEVFKK